MAAPVFTLDTAQDLLAAFDVGDDPESREFLANLLTSGTAPKDEVAILCQIGGGETESEKRRKRRKRAKRAKTLTAISLTPAADKPAPNKRPKKRRRRRGKTKKHDHINHERTPARGKGKPCEAGRANASACKSPFFADRRADRVDGRGCDCDASSTDSVWADEDDEDGEDSDGWILDSVRGLSVSSARGACGQRTAQTVAIVTRRTVLSAGPELSESAVTQSTESPPEAPPVQPLGVPWAPPEKAILSRSPSPSPAKSTPQKRSLRETTSFFFSAPETETKKKKKQTTLQTDCGDDDGTRGDDTGSRDSEAPTAPTTPSPTKQSRRGLVSALPFPPLDSPSFGLVQEELADEPFWLLVALVFLTRVAGRVSLPVFWAIKQKYPTPQDLVEADCSRLIASMRHLGMSSVRCAALQRYARRWIEQPPCAGVVTTVKNYPPLQNGQNGDAVSSAPPASTGSQWEIGHITQGAYSIDSWRIFCRDRLLGRSTDWKGDPDHRNAGKEAFQPEWMRVLPQDKELRACLRWMWMREGWDWDPKTGDRTVLRDELRRAVNEGRVGYDAQGQLQIVSEQAWDTSL